MEITMGSTTTMSIRILALTPRLVTETAPPVPVLNFPKSSEGLRRQKRDWVIPPLQVTENYRGSFPQRISQIKSNNDKKIYYSITGPGADKPPVNLFKMDRDSGNLYVTQQLDREKKSNYTLEAHAISDDGATAEKSMEITIVVIDQNDNNPVFNQSTYIGEVAEASKIGSDVIQVFATDADDPLTDNGIIRYSILNQDPKQPKDNMFAINPVTGVIRVNAGGLDRENYPQYTLDVRVADMDGVGLSGDAKVILKVTDSNDNAPVFTKSSYAGTVPENQVDALVVTMLVTDGDEPHSKAWNAVFKIMHGDPEGLFSVKTGANKQEGIITTAKGLDFETTGKHTLLVTVENEVPFVTPLTTSTATVVVTVKDVNEAPIFEEPEKLVSKKESLSIDSPVLTHTAFDPDTARNQKVRYKMIKDPAGWLNIARDTGVITVKKEMDRESPFVKDEHYKVLIGAYDDDEIPATGTGTLIIKLEDVNDNAPTIVERDINVCSKKPVPQLLNVIDEDGPTHGAPFDVTLHELSKANWTAKMNGTKTGILLTLNADLPEGFYNVGLWVSDHLGEKQLNSLNAHVCACTGDEFACIGRVAGGDDLPVILGILGGVLLLLMLALLLLLFARRRGGRKEEPLLQDEDFRDNIYYYDEEGGGEDDQDFDLSVLHRGLDNRPGVMRDDVAPTYMSAPRYRTRPANPDEIGTFIDENLKAADNDPTAPPYDSLLVFDYEGGGSDAGSLSSLNSCSSGDQDYNCLSDWGPRFKKLADMYGGGEDDML
ncbi:B-cadherin-like [Xenentodon cancila]